MERIGGELLADIDKETVDFQPNYDDKEVEPTVLPARFPARQRRRRHRGRYGDQHPAPPTSAKSSTPLSWPPTPDVTTDELWRIVTVQTPRPGGFICSTARPHAPAGTGRGALFMRARTNVEDHVKTGGKSIVTEPFVPGQQGQADRREFAGAGARQAHRRHGRHPRFGSRRHAHRNGYQEGRRAGGGAQQPLKMTQMQASAHQHVALEHALLAGRKLSYVNAPVPTGFLGS